jgi:hypothetical protein
VRASPTIKKVDIGAEATQPAKHYNEWHSQWTITANLRVKGGRNSRSHFDIMENQIVFTLRSEGTNAALVTMNLPQMNQYLYKAWEWLDTHAGTLAERARAAGEAGEKQSGLMQYFTLPEACWDKLFKSNNSALKQDNIYKLMRYCTQQGILSRCQYSGVITVPPVSMYAAGVRPQMGKDVSATVAVAGNVVMDHYFSPQATAGANLFLILKRMPHPRSSRECGPFAFVPADSHHSGPHMSLRRYNDFSGNAMYAWVIYLAIVIDKRGAASKTEALPEMIGLKGSATDHMEALKNPSKLLVCLKRPKARFFL